MLAKSGLTDLILLRRLAAASQFAYRLAALELPGEFSLGEARWFIGPGKQEHVAAVVVPYGGALIVAFQGTNLPQQKNYEQNLRVLRDWIDNFTVVLDEFALGTRGRMHRGFFRQLQIIWTDLAEYLHQRNTPIYVTGHSQGGALAILATKLFEQQGQRVLGTVTFGAPRVGNRCFVESINSPILRVEYDNDPVPWIPPCLPRMSNTMKAGLLCLMPDNLRGIAELILSKGTHDGINYCAAGNLLYLQPGKVWQTTLSKAEEFQRFLRLFAAGRKLVNDHWIETYMAALEEAKLIAPK